MKTNKRLFILFCCTVILFSNIFMCYTTPVHAKPTLDDEGHLHVYNWDDIKDCAVDWVMYMASLAGAVFADRDFAKYVQNKESWVNYWTEDNVTINEGGTSVTFSKELMAFIKQCIDDYAKEHEPYFTAMPYTLTLLPNTAYGDQKNVYDSINNLLNDSPSGIIGIAVVKDSSGAKIIYTDIGDYFRDIGLVCWRVEERYHLSRVQAYSIETWARSNFYRYEINLKPEDSAIKNRADMMSRAEKTYTEFYNNMNSFCALDTVGLSMGVTSSGGYGLWSGGEGASILLSKDQRRIRIYNTFADFQDYTLGKRSVYYTKEYYSYVPEDLSVSIDDLQKSVDDLQKIIDELLKQISDNTSESEIEDLLKKILEELQKNPGGTGGDTPGGGDVTVDIDLSTTNSWLAKIYAKVSEIFDKMQSGGSDGTGSNIFQKGLDAVLTKLDELHVMLKKYLSEITGDLNDIKGKLDEMTEEEFEEKSDSFLKEMMDTFSEVSDVAKGKFPFSIPNDIRILIERIAVTSPAPAALYSNDIGISVYSDDNGGGGVSGGDATDPSGGGGTSRPPSGFIDVEHGGGGGSRGPVEERDGAPVFRLPIVLERYGIEEYIVIDMSPFEPVSRMSRALFTVMFMLCLYNMTFKVMGLWGDLVG